MDDNGQPTRVDRRCFRLNIEDGRTESIDEEWAEVRNMYGFPDGTNNRRHAMKDEWLGGGEVFGVSDTIVNGERGYQADVSEDEDQLEVILLMCQGAHMLH